MRTSTRKAGTIMIWCSGSPSSGSSSDQNSIQNDGIEVAAPSSGAAYSMPNPDTIQEEQVIGIGASAEYAGFQDRACLVSGANGGIFRRKAGAAVVPVRRGGAVHAFDLLNRFFLITELIVPGSCYWNIGIAREIGLVGSSVRGHARRSHQDMPYATARRRA